MSVARRPGGKRLGEDRAGRLGFPGLSAWRTRPPLVREALQQGCAISAANWAEVLSKVAEGGEDPVQTVERFERGVLGQALVVYTR